VGERGRRSVGLGLILASLAGTLALGYLVKHPCVSGDWSDERQYARYCYSDIVPLLHTEQLSGGRLPYLDPCAPTDGGVCDEYPVLSMYAMRLAAWMSKGTAGFYHANMAILTLAAVAAVACLYLGVGRRALYLALAPSLLLYAYFNWDLIPVALTAGAALAYLRRRDVWAGALLGLGAATKLYPALFVVPFVAGRLRGREPDRAIHLAWAAAGTWLAVNLPFMIWGTRGWWEFFAFSSRRATNWDSLWYVACERLTDQTCGDVQAVNAASFVLYLGLVTLVWWAKASRDPGFARWTLGFPVLVLFLLTNKVYSPQYSLWLVPWFALALPDVRLFVAFELSDLAVFLSEFSWFASFGVSGGVSYGTFQVALLLRAAVLTACVVAWYLRRGEVRALEPVPARALAADGAPA